MNCTATKKKTCVETMRASSSPLLHPPRSRIAAEGFHLDGDAFDFEGVDGLLEHTIGMVAADFEEEAGLGAAASRTVLDLSHVDVAGGKDLQDFHERADAILGMDHEHGVVVAGRRAGTATEDDETRLSIHVGRWR